MATYLQFEENLKKIEEEIILANTKSDEYAAQILQAKLDKEVKKVFGNLSDYQKVQLARHPDRPYGRDYIKALLEDEYEICGERHFKDDRAIICSFGYIAGKKVLIIAEQKGRGTKNKLKRNFGMPNPEGYRKALRAARLAEKFEIPILMLVDTPGAYPGIGAEERNQSEAIARNLYEFSNLKTITISVVIGEGGSGGALAISVADKLAMMSYAVYSVISPEGCASILWSDPSQAETAANSLKLTAMSLKELNLIDDIVPEPLIGAHKEKELAYKAVGEYFINTLTKLEKISKEQRCEDRYNKLMKLGAFSE